MRERSRKHNILLRVLAAVFWLAVWQLAAWLTGNEILFPSPFATARVLAEMALTGDFWASVGMTLLRVTAGFLLGMAAGTLLGALSAASGVARVLLSPLRTVVRATPVTSVILLVILWLTSSLTPVFIAFLMVTPIFWENVQRGVGAVDGDLAEMAAVFRLSPATRLRKLYAPAVQPYFLAAAGTGLGIAWKSGVAAEVLAMPALSIGLGLRESKLYIESAHIFAWTAVVIILSLLIENLLLKWLRGLRRDDKA